MVERTVGHSTQHARQIASLPEKAGFAPDRPLSADVYAAYLSLAKSGMRCNPRS